MDFEQWLTDLVEAAQLAANTATFHHGPAVFLGDPDADSRSPGEKPDQIVITLLR